MAGESWQQPDRPAMRIGPIHYRQTPAEWIGSPCEPPSRLLCSSMCEKVVGGGRCPSQSLSADLLQMFEESTLSDVEIVCTVDQGQKFQAHQLVLAARSPVFKAMFLSGMRERRIGKVVIEDACPKAIQCMLGFAYKDECSELDDSCITDVLKIANKYDMPGLRDICLDFMARNARSDNIINFISVCESFGYHDFKHLLLNALVDQPPALHECIHGQSLDASPDIMKHLLTLCCHRLSRNTKEQHVAKHFDGLPYRSRCYVCAREVASMPKQMLGEMLFPLVQKMSLGHCANKITGMIIELDNQELVPLFESESALQEKVEEAVAVLRAAEEETAAEEEPLQGEDGGNAQTAGARGRTPIRGS